MTAKVLSFVRHTFERDQVNGDETPMKIEVEGTGYAMLFIKDLEKSFWMEKSDVEALIAILNRARRELK